MKIILPLALIIFFSACNGNQNEEDPTLVVPGSGIAAPKKIEYTILNQFPHDTSAYTQGLEFYNGKLYESTGDFINSSLRITDAKTGNVIDKHMMGTDIIFGEGITVFNNKIYQLTWQNKIIYQYDINNIKKPIQTFSWPYEGWGITHNDSLLIISDGSANLYFVNPTDLKVMSTISVNDNNGAVLELNELEYVDGFIYANIYLKNRIVKIDPESGHVVGEIIFPELLAPNEKVADRTDVLNGIAYNKETNTFFITGKRWPKMFEIKMN